MYSLSRTPMTAERTTRENLGAKARPMAMVRFSLVLPKAAMMARARSTSGRLRKTSMARMMTLSIFPP